MSGDFAVLTVEGYAQKALTTDQGSDAKSMAFPMLGLFGETGSLLSEVKKKQRDQASTSAMQRMSSRSWAMYSGI